MGGVSDISNKKEKIRWTNTIEVLEDNKGRAEFYKDPSVMGRSVEKEREKDRGMGKGEGGRQWVGEQES